MDLRGGEGVGVLELRQEGVEERRGLDLFRLFEKEFAPILEDASPHDEDADGDVATGLEEAEDVHALSLKRLHELVLRDIFDGPDRVAIGGGHLEVLPRRGLEHLALEARKELP